MTDIEAMRYGFDGFGYRYIDSGSGSDWRTRYPDAEPLYAQPQTDTLHEQLLQECLVKLRDVQGTQAPKQYACNLIKRIERVLQGQSE